MGYTHYWDFKRIPRGKADQVNSSYKFAIEQCQLIIQSYNAELKKQDDKHPNRLSGYSVHTVVGKYGGIKVNGTGELSHEDFCLRERYKQNLEKDYWGFCKTARKPYDTVVVACLIILKHHLNDLLVVSSDGDSKDWFQGLKLAKQVTGIKTLKIPFVKLKNVS